MARCDNGSKEFGAGDGFERWPEPAREVLAKELRRIINANMLSGFAIGVDRKYWDKEIQGDRRRLVGDPEGFCIRRAIEYSIKWAKSRRCECDPELGLFFDKRPGRIGEIAAVHEVFSPHEYLNLLDQQVAIFLLPVEFVQMDKSHQLQAADLFAWEFYQVANDALNGLGDTARREQMRELVNGSNGRLLCAMTAKEQIDALKKTGPKDDQFAEFVKQLPKSWNWKVK